MKERGRHATRIPARVTVAQLAETVGLDLGELQDALGRRGEPSAPDDVLGAKTAIAVTSSLGLPVSVEARDMVLECLYEFDSRGELGEDPPGRAGRLVEGVIRHIDDLDTRIESVAEHWSVARMPQVDRNILRLGLYELEHEPGTSKAIIVSEAVRLAQTYSTERSSSFVNGVLATLAEEIRG